MINIAKILKNVPKGTKLYSLVIGECILLEVKDDDEYPIRVKINNYDNNNNYEMFTKDGKYFDGDYGANGECLLFPSKENRNWDKFKIEKYEFKPFDKVLARDSDDSKWRCDLFSSKGEHYYICVGEIWNQCIPYNEDTKHLIGTSKAFV